MLDAVTPIEARRPERTLTVSEGSKTTPCSASECTLGSCPLLHELGVSKTYSPNSVVFFEGDDAAHYFLITSGVLRGCKLLEDGRRQINRFIFAGDLIGYSINPKYTFTVEAVTPVTLVALRRSAVENRVEASPCLHSAIMKSVLSELDEMQDQLVTLGRMNAEERVSRFLCLLAERSASMPAGLARDDLAQIEIPMCRNDIADYLGLTIETVSRVLSRLKADGKIAMPSCNRIVLTGRDRLKTEPGDIAA